MVEKENKKNNEISEAQMALDLMNEQLENMKKIEKMQSDYLDYIEQNVENVDEKKIDNKKDIKEIEDLIPELIKKLKLGYRIFSISTIVINLIFWYYITSFCAIYSIIQTHMISDSLMSFLLSISYSILLSLISSIIRVAALKKESKLRHFFYTISLILSLI